MTPSQLQTLAAHIRANADAEVVAALAVRNDVALAQWYNQPSTSLAWCHNVQRQELFGALNLTTYDGLTAGKRDSFRLIFDSAPVDFTNDKIRAGIVDIFALADENAMLWAGTCYATRGELVFGGTSATSSSVTAIKRSFTGEISLDDVSNALNGY